MDKFLNGACADEIARLRDMLTWPVNGNKRDIVLRRIYALEQEIEYANPFNDVDETLFRIVHPLIGENHSL